jgi:hypothetical protein
VGNEVRYLKPDFRDIDGQGPGLGVASGQTTTKPPSPQRQRFRLRGALPCRHGWLCDRRTWGFGELLACSVQTKTCRSEDSGVWHLPAQTRTEQRIRNQQEIDFLEEKTQYNWIFLAHFCGGTRKRHKTQVRQRSEEPQTSGPRNLESDDICFSR